MSSAVIVSDYMLSPLEMEAYSLQGFQKMVTVINNLRKLNPNLKFLGMVPNKVDGRKPRHVKNLSTLRQSYPDKIRKLCRDRPSFHHFYRKDTPEKAYKRLF